MQRDAQITDAARRARDIVNGKLAAYPWEQLRHQWLAIRLSDGGSDGTLYDSKRDAVRHQLDEKLCAYIAFRNIAAGTNAQDMQIFLDFNRAAYDAGMRMPDPDDQFGGPELIDSVTREDMAAQLAAFDRMRRR